MNIEEQMSLPLARPPRGPLPERLMLRLGDGYSTPVYAFAPPGGTDGIPVVYAHGIQSHPGWYFASARAIANTGRWVYLVTRRGCGENTKDRAHCKSAKQLLDDVDAACTLAMQHASHRQVSLLGVSWGGKLLLAYSLSPARTARLEQLILVAPGLTPKVDASPVLKLAIAFNVLVRPRARFAIPLGEPKLFTNNPRFQHFLRNDSLSLHHATARFFYSSRVLDTMISRCRDNSLQTPVLLMLASDDKIIFNNKTEQLVRRLAGRSCKAITINGSHTLEFEHDPTEFFDALTTGMMSDCSSTTR